MHANQKEIVNILIKKGTDLLKNPHEESFSENDEANKIICDINKYPHAFVLACVMDRQIKAERAWEIPYKIAQEIGGFEFSKLSKVSLNDYKQIFNKKDTNGKYKFHRFPSKMAKFFYLAVNKLDDEYQGEASKIWNNNPKSGDVVIRFLEFEGVGVKIATMAANILARYFKIPMQDHFCIDVSPDRQVKRVFERIGLIRKNARIEELVYCAKKLYPEYPGVFDGNCWTIGRDWCKPRNPKCNECYLDKLCSKII